MRTIIIERSTRSIVADCRTVQEAKLMAIKRCVANSDMLIVMGISDINLYKFAVLMHKEFSLLIQLHHKYDVNGYKVDLAPDRCDLWRRIAESREVLKGKEYARPLSGAIGAELANDIEQLMLRKDHPYVRIVGIDRSVTWSKAYSQATWLSSRHRYLKFFLHIHEILGIVVIAPLGHFTEHRNFEIKRSFGPKWPSQ